MKKNGVKLPLDIDESFLLTQYAVQTRYPGEWEPITKQEADRALEIAALVLNWVDDQINLQTSS